MPPTVDSPRLSLGQEKLSTFPSSLHNIIRWHPFQGMYLHVVAVLFASSFSLSWFLGNAYYAPFILSLSYKGCRYKAGICHEQIQAEHTYSLTRHHRQSQEENENKRNETENKANSIASRQSSTILRQRGTSCTERGIAADAERDPSAAHCIQRLREREHDLQSSCWAVDQGLNARFSRQPTLDAGYGVCVCVCARVCVCVLCRRDTGSTAEQTIRSTGYSTVAHVRTGFLDPSIDDPIVPRRIPAPGRPARNKEE